MKMKKSKNNIIVTIVVSAAALLLAVANLVLCYIYDMEKPLSTLIVICIAIVFAFNLAYYISSKRKKKKETDIKDDTDE